jgi:hypothetical protein
MRWRPRYYTLDGHTPVPCDDVMVWAQWFENFELRVVAQTQIGDRFVSTVFLGIDHNFGPTGPPLIFETMVFGPNRNEEWMKRTATWDEALADHAAALAKLTLGEPRLP